MQDLKNIFKDLGAIESVRFRSVVSFLSLSTKSQMSVLSSSRFLIVVYSSFGKIQQCPAGSPPSGMQCNAHTCAHTQGLICLRCLSDDFHVFVSRRQVDPKKTSINAYVVFKEEDGAVSALLRSYSLELMSRS